jgi:hypothetical protein
MADKDGKVVYKSVGANIPPNLFKIVTDKRWEKHMTITEVVREALSDWVNKA